MICRQWVVDAVLWGAGALTLEAVVSSQLSVLSENQKPSSFF
jgi:hypothetical protein